MANISSLNIGGTAYKLRIEGDNDAANPGAGALLRSGSGRADASPSGDTWLYWDSLGGTSTPWGIRHNQGANTMSWIGGGTERVKIYMGESKVEATTFAGKATSAGSADSATKATQDSDGNTIKSTYLKLGGGTMTGALHVSNTGKLIYDYTGSTETAMFTLNGAENYGFRYKEGNPDTLKISASGNANTDAGADLCINGNGEGTVTIRGKTIAHAGNVGTGDNNGQVKIAGENVSVKGLGSAAYTASTAYAAASHTHGEATLTWGGTNITGDISPVGMAISAEHSTNRLAFINGDALTFEYSSNNGSTWTNYNFAKLDKTAFCTSTLNVPIGRASGSTEYTTSMQTRVTLTAQNGTTGYVYTNPRKMLIYMSSACGVSVTVEYRTGTNYQNNGAWSTFGTYTVSGWSGWNDIPLILSTLGGGTTQTGNNWQLRLTFKITSIASNKTYCNVLGIRIFGTNPWITTSNMGNIGHLYSYDMSQNATFPAQITATQFNGTLNGNASTATKANYLNGWSGAVSSQAWGNQTGTFIFGMDDSTGGSLAFRRDNPSSGQVSMIIDGTVYIKEGAVNVGDAIKSITRNGTTFTYTTLWGNTGTFTQQDSDTKYNFSGTAFTSNNSTAQNANDITYNAHTYYTSNGPATNLGATTNDGALYTQAYSTSWVAQIAQDYRNGGLFVRGKNNGTWQAWAKVYDSNHKPTAADIGAATSGHTHTYSDVGAAASSHTHTMSQITWPGNQNLTTSATANGQEWSIDLTPGSYTGTYWHVWSSKNSKSILCCYTDDNKVTIPNGNLEVSGTIKSGGTAVSLSGHTHTVANITDITGGVYYGSGTPARTTIYKLYHKGGN